MTLLECTAVSGRPLRGFRSERLISGLGAAAITVLWVSPRHAIRTHHAGSIPPAAAAENHDCKRVTNIVSAGLAQICR